MNYLDCMDLAQAKELVLRSLAGVQAGSETIDLSEAVGRVTAAAIQTTADLPPFSRSTVDGFAVRSMDSFGACESAPALFFIVGNVWMGMDAEGKLSPGEALSIPTGGMLPAGADAVVMLEYTEQPDEQTLLVQKAVSPYENVLTRGEDVAAGDLLLGAGVEIRSRHIGLLAACGVHHIQVRKKIRVALISTGDELVCITKNPAPGQIRDVNSHSLAALLKERGCEVEKFGILSDSFDHFCSTLRRAVQEFQLVVISGGSSVGAKDFTFPAVQTLGRPGILFHGLAIKPGKPTLFAMIGSVPVFGLPGHPFAALIVCDQLVSAAVRQMNGVAEQGPAGLIPAILNRNVASAPGRDDFIPVTLVRGAEGYTAEPILGKSGLIRILAKSDGLVHIPADKSGLYKGEKIFVQPVPGGMER